VLAQDIYGGDSYFLTILLVQGVIFGLICAVVWSHKGGSAVVGFLAGLFLGLIGLIIVAVISPGADAKQKAATMRECPHCKEQMRRDASVCPHCQRESKPWVRHEGRWWFKDDAGVQYYLVDEKRQQWVKWER
jgi:hypothetical protein